MDVSLQGFSIREYVSGKRSEDVRKCWPFGEAAGEIEKLLPPMVRRKQVWWSDVLEGAKLRRSGEQEMGVSGGLGKEMSFREGSGGIEDADAAMGNLGLDEEAAVKICPVCEIFTATTINAMNAHIDSCLAKASKEERRQIRLAKAKSKAPKKRSILEIFAVSPHVEAVEDEEEEEEDLDPESEGEGSGRDLPKMKKQKKSEETATKKRRKKMKKKKQFKKSLSKGKHGEPFSQRGLDTSDLPQGSKRRQGRKAKVVVCMRKKAPSKLKVHPKKNQIKSVCASKLVAKVPGEACYEVLGCTIQKNRKQNTSLEKVVKRCRLKGAKKDTLRKSDRSVKFSGKDDIVVPPKKWCSHLELCHIQSSSEQFLNVEGRSLDRDIHSLDKDPGDGENVKDVDSDGADIPFLCEKRRVDDVSLHVPPVSVGYSLDLNEVFHGYDNLQSLNSSKTSLSHDLSFPMLQNSILEHENNVGIQSQVERCDPRLTSTRYQLDAFGTATPTPTPVGSLEPMSRNAMSQDSLSILERNMDENEKQPFHCQATGFNSKVPHCSLPNPLSTKDLISGTCSTNLMKNVAYGTAHVGEPRVASSSISLHGRKSFNEDFIGLPLNSQGELIHLHSNGKRAVNKLKKPKVTSSSIGSFQTNSHMGLMSIAAQCNMVEKLNRLAPIPGQGYLNPPASLSSGLALSKLRGGGMTESVNGLREHNKHAEKDNVNEIILESSSLGSDSHRPQHPTVRLMGKNVTLGKINSEDHILEDGKIWTDKEIITEQGPPVVNFSGNSNARQHIHLPSSISKEFGSHPLNAQSPLCPNFFRIKTTGSDISHAYQNSMLHQISGGRLQPINATENIELRPLLSQKLSENCISRTSSFWMGDQKQFQVSYTPNSFPRHMIQFPFSSQDYVTFQHNSGQCPSSSHPQWLRPATPSKETLLVSPFPSGHSLNQQKQVVMSGTDSFAYSAPYSLATISFHSHNSCTSNSSPEPSSIVVHPSFVQAIPGMKSTQENVFRNESDRGLVGILKPIGYSKPAKTTKKRSAPKENVLTKPTKRPHLLLQEDSETAAELGGRERAILNLYDSGANKDQTVDQSFSGLETETDRCETSLGVWKKPDNASTLGPIKLSAGAKHILKPSQSMDEYNARPIHATIPFAGATDSGRLPGFEIKTAKIYRF